MSDIISSLRRQDFPRCAASALKHIGTVSTQGDGGGIPGLGGSSEDLPQQIAKQFVFCENKTGSKVIFRTQTVEKFLYSVFVLYSP